MKKIILSLLLVSVAVQAETKIQPQEDGPVEKDRIVSQLTSGILDRVITDKKTGCQYGITIVAKTHINLGCFPEYIDPKFKK